MAYALYKTDNSYVSGSGTEEGEGTSDGMVNGDWNTLDCNVPPAIIDTDYIIVWWGDNSTTLYYDSVGGIGGMDESHSWDYDNWPSVTYNSSAFRKYSIYVTYTPSAPPAGTLEGNLEVKGGATLKINPGSRLKINP